MKSIYAAEDYTFSIPLNQPADTDSIVWTLRDNTGTAMGSYTNQALANAPGALSIEVPIPAAANTKTLGNESRFIVVNWTSGGQRYTLTYPYVLIDFIPLRAQPQDVRTVLALNEAELDDSEIDLISASTLVSTDITPAIFNAALIAGDLTTDQVNLLVVYRAAILLGPSLGSRLSSSMSVEGNKFSRLGGLSPEKIVQGLRDQYDRIRTDLTNPAYIPPVIFGTSQRGPDPFISLIPWPLAPFVGQTGVWRI